MHQSDDDRVRLAACQLITERGWGKAPEASSIEREAEATAAMKIDWFRTSPEQRAEVERFLRFMGTLPQVSAELPSADDGS
jgi:hypothetical protein